jgi:hypothetical protein
MSLLNLVGPPAILTKTVKIADPANPQATILQSFNCDVDGAQLGSGVAPTLIYRDLITGQTFARVTEKIPNANTSAGAAAATAISERSPIHFTNDDGSINGWFVPAPDFNERDPETAVAAKAAADAAAAETAAAQREAAAAQETAAAERAEVAAAALRTGGV